MEEVGSNNSQDFQWLKFEENKQKISSYDCDWELKAKLDLHVKATPSVVDIVSCLEQGAVERGVSMFCELSVYQQIEVFLALSDEQINVLLGQQIPKSNFFEVVEVMPYECRLKLGPLLACQDYGQLSSSTSLIDQENPDTTQDIYLSDTAGEVMRSNFTVVLYSMTIGEAVDKIRKTLDSKKMFYHVYVVDEYMKLLGFISLEDLVIGAPQDKVSSIIKTEFLYAIVDDSKEEVAQKIDKHDLVALPVVNYNDQIVGIVTYDEAIDIITAAYNADTDLLMGITSNENDPSYLSTSTLQHLKKRVKWIVIVFMASIISQTFIHAKHELFMMHHFILYIGMITDTGGNVGSQVASVILQALNRNQISLSDFCKVLFKELQIAFLLAVIFFILTFVKISFITNMEPNVVKSYGVMFVIALSVFCQIICSAFIGAALPLTAKFFKGDPAIASNPVINTTVELLGVVIYYAIVSWLINSTYLFK